MNFYFKSNKIMKKPNIKKFYFTFPENTIFRKNYVVIENVSPLFASIGFIAFFGKNYGNIYNEETGIKIVEENNLVKFELDKKDLIRYKYNDIIFGEFCAEASSTQNVKEIFEICLMKPVNFFSIKLDE